MGKKQEDQRHFEKMYETLGFEKTVAISRLPIIKPVLDFGYYVFLCH